MNPVPDWLGAVFAAVLGAIIGSFLNAVIHRLPRGISLSNPRRSFCPECKTPIPWYYNLPLISYLWLRGKCAFCGCRIPLRYWMVEFLTAALFLGVWLLHGWLLFIPYSILLALLIAATFIDIDHLIIPDEITIGGTVAGILLSLAIPAMMSTDSHWMSALLSLGGAAAGFFSLWLVVELGKLAFGKKRVRLEKPESFVWIRKGETAELRVGADLLTWEEIFSRPTDELHLRCNALALGVREAPAQFPADIRFRFDKLFLPDGSELLLDDLEKIEGTVSSITIPREAMGFGDVKFLAAIGAFLGWQSVVFTIMASSLIGCAVGLGTLLLTRGKGGGLLPFGPFLALGAVVWIFGGASLWHWYLQGGFANLLLSR